MLFENRILSSLLSLSRQASNFASLGPITRPVYARLYPVKLIKPDGSSINILYHEPIGLIKLPFDLSQLDENEKRRRLLRRQTSVKVDAKRAADNLNIIDKKTKFDPKKYININKNKPK